MQQRLSPCGEVLLGILGCATVNVELKRADV
jgi:hypothetical protein